MGHSRATTSDARALKVFSAGVYINDGSINAGCGIAGANDVYNVGSGRFFSDICGLVQSGSVPFRSGNGVFFHPRITVPRGGVDAASLNADAGVAGTGSNIIVCFRRVGILVFIVVRVTDEDHSDAFSGHVSRSPDPVDGGNDDGCLRRARLRLQWARCWAQ